MLLGYIDPAIVTGPWFTSSPRSPEGFMSERYVNDDPLAGRTTGVDVLGCEPTPVGVCAGDEAAFDDVSATT
jgi:hypothetical protein